MPRSNRTKRVPSAPRSLVPYGKSLRLVAMSQRVALAPCCSTKTTASPALATLPATCTAVRTFAEMLAGETERSGGGAGGGLAGGGGDGGGPDGGAGGEGDGWVGGAGGGGCATHAHAFRHQTRKRTQRWRRR